MGAWQLQHSRKLNKHVLKFYDIPKIIHRSLGRHFADKYKGQK